MIILAINTASSRTAIALFEKSGEETQLLSENFWQSQNDEAEKLMPSIAKLLENAGKSFTNIKKVFVVRGPGSFTGLRVGVTVANTIAYLNKCELSGITTFEYWWSALAEELNKQFKNHKTALLVFAGKGGVYLSEGPDKEAELVNLDQLNSVLKEKNIQKVFGDITDEQKSVLENAEFKDFNKSFGEIMKKIVRNARLRAEAETWRPGMSTVTPFYIKPPSISQSKKIQACST